MPSITMPVSCPALRKAGGAKKLAFGTNSNDKFFHMPSKHAEMDALRKLNYKNLPRTVDIFVIRISKTGILGESRPCIDCLKMMERSGLNIKYIYYSTKDGTILRERFSKMFYSDSTYVSSGIRTKNNPKTKLI